MMKRAFLLATGTALCALAAPAAAKPIYIEMKGTLYGGSYDNLNIFGFGSSIDGYAATLLYEFDSSSFYDAGNSFYDDGANYSYTTLLSGSVPSVKATVTVNGVTKSLDTQTIFSGSTNSTVDSMTYEKYNDYWWNQYDQIDGYTYDNETVRVGSRYNSYNARSSGSIYGDKVISDTDLTNPVYNHIDPDGDPYGYAWFQFDKTVGRDSAFTATVGNLQLTSFVVGPLGPVPEPSTWAMMIVGFGGVGAALRRNRGRRGASGQQLAFA